MRRDELVVGDTYFMVTYPEEQMLAPVVISYRYLGVDLAGEREDSPQYYFRYLPAFQHEGEQEPEESEASWRELLPELFQGWGADIPTSFEEIKLAGLVTLDGLIKELTDCRARRVRGDQ